MTMGVTDKKQDCNEMYRKPFELLYYLMTFSSFNP